MRGPSRINSMPVKWFNLITRTLALADKTGYGYANIWAAIHKEQYHTALAILERCEADADEVVAVKTIFGNVR